MRKSLISGPEEVFWDPFGRGQAYLSERAVETCLYIEAERTALGWRWLPDTWARGHVLHDPSPGQVDPRTLGIVLRRAPAHRTR